MTEKRFELVDIGFVYDNDKLIGMKEIVDLLNSLNEENEKLKQNCKNYEWYKQYKAVLNENEQLKEKIDKLEGMLINNGLM